LGLNVAALGQAHGFVSRNIDGWFARRCKGRLRCDECQNEGCASTNLHNAPSSAELAVILACKPGYNLEETPPAAKPLQHG
jgi:hypothetical protein